MKILIDTSILIAVIAGEKEKDAIVKKTMNAELLAPLSVHFEIGNALSALMKRHRCNLNDVKKALDIYSRIPVEYLNVDLSHSLLLCEKYNIYAYDAYILSSCIKNNITLFSLDKKMNHIASELGINNIEV